MAAKRLQFLNWPAFLLVIVIGLISVCDVIGERDRFEVRRRKILLDGQLQRHQPPPVQRTRPRSGRPNIVMILTDDQDVLLGSLKAMPKLQELMIDRGALFNNTFVSTPMCCPSRSSILTGLYVHNHNVYTNNDNCSSTQWQREHEPRTFGAYLQAAGYRTGYFGKYLNKYNGSYTPAGWDKWIGLVRNSRFYNYTLSYDGRLQRHYDNYYNDYLTDRIANDSVAFFKRSKRLYSTKPVLMVLSVPAPHGPEDAAPQYQHMFVNNTDHRTPSWNVAPNEDKQWLLRQTKPMTPQFKIFTDLLQRRRLQTLQSVDDLVEKVYTELQLLGELDNTYVLYTSDHGYHLGQFGLIKGKSLAYDFDTRVPLLITGPGVKHGLTVSNVASNVDLAPTILDMGGVDIPKHMDGASLLPLLKSSQKPDSKSFIRTSEPWRETVLLERGKVSKKMLKTLMREEKFILLNQNRKNLHLYLTMKQQKILRQCSKKNFQPPCKQNQKWYCEKDEIGRTRLYKCRDADHANNHVDYEGDQLQECRCSDGRLGVRVASISSVDTALPTRRRRRRHRRFLRQHLKRRARNKLVRQRRSAMSDSIHLGAGAGSVLQLGSASGVQYPGFDLLKRRCRFLMNNTVSCDQDIYRDYDQWESHRERLDEMIKEYKKILEDLRGIREHLLDHRPPHFIENLDIDGNLDDGVRRIESGGEVCNCENETLPSRNVGGRRRQRKEQKFQRRALRHEEREQRRSQRRGLKKRKCDGNSMKCFSHNNDHWKTPPYWELFEEEEGGDVANGCPSLRQHKRFNYPHCYTAGLECALMDNCHWKTPPFWTYGPFCFCSNANNNTYWCMRTVNSTSNFLYCEYITKFIAFYDMITDPFQLRNVAKELNYGILQQLHDQLAVLKMCQGEHSCNLRNLKDFHVYIDDDDVNLREHPVYEDSSGEGDNYDDEDDRAGDYDEHSILDQDDYEDEDFQDFDELEDPDQNHDQNPDQDPDFF